MTYKERKNQLNNAVVSFLKNNTTNGDYYGFTKESKFNAYFCGEIGRETLIELYLLDDGKNVAVTTEQEDGYRDTSVLTEFTNDEIVSIMELAGIDIPTKKVEKSKENPCIIGFFVVSL